MTFAQVAQRDQPGTGIVKPLPPQLFTTHAADGAVLDAETRWEAMADGALATPNERFFVRNHAPTPVIDTAAWRLRIEGPGVARPQLLDYGTLLNLPAVTVTGLLECAGNGRVFFDEVQRRPEPGAQWRLGAVGVASWTGVPLRVVLERAGLAPGA